MELKRFVLLSDKTILTKKEFESQRKVDLFYADRLFVKHSDNILDLVDSMDLIGCYVRNEFINNEVTYMVITNPLYFADLVFFLVNGDKVWFRDSQYEDKKKYDDIERNGIKVVSIYKRQPNGNYKRYSIDV